VDKRDLESMVPPHVAEGVPDIQGCHGSLWPDTGCCSDETNIVVRATAAAGAILVGAYTCCNLVTSTFDDDAHSKCE
jgi:hypothetical protein